jgi:hypothetical protein
LLTKLRGEKNTVLTCTHKRTLPKPVGEKKSAKGQFLKRKDMWIYGKRFLKRIFASNPMASPY